MNSSNLAPSEYAPSYAPYLATLTDGDLIEELEISLHDFIRFVREIPMGKHDFRYAEGKWTIKQIIQHLIDAERVFSYRALRFARKDQTPLPGFEEDAYAAAVDADSRHLQALLTELSIVRESTLALFRTFGEEALLRMGTASGKAMSVRAAGFVIIGHMKHHQRVFAERYL